MAGKNCADIVFCIDASGSMQPCLDAVKQNVDQLLKGLDNEEQGASSWDVRFDFVSFCDSSDGVHKYRSTRLGTCAIVDKIYHHPDPSAFFTKNLAEFSAALGQVQPEGEEMHLLALDIAMDFPWRASSECHRVVVLLSDEPLETGVFVEEQKEKLDAIINKTMEKRIKLFIIAPESDAFYCLSSADRCEYTDLESTRDGLRSVDFSRMLSAIGKSVSVSQSYDGGSNEPKPLFEQDTFVSCDASDMGRDN